MSLHSVHLRILAPEMRWAGFFIITFLINLIFIKQEETELKRLGKTAVAFCWAHLLIKALQTCLMRPGFAMEICGKALCIQNCKCEPNIAIYVSCMYVSGNTKIIMVVL